MHSVLPVFPLSIVAFPGESINLHIFEPRYIQLITECDKAGKTFGLPLFFNKKLYSTGTEMELIEIVKHHPEGRMDIRVRGIGRFHGDTSLFHEEGKLYSSCHIKRFTGNSTSDAALQERLLQLLTELHKAAEVNDKLPISPLDLETFKIAHFAGLNPVQ